MIDDDTARRERRAEFHRLLIVAGAVLSVGLAFVALVGGC